MFKNLKVVSFVDTYLLFVQPKDPRWPYLNIYLPKDFNFI